MVIYYALCYILHTIYSVPYIEDFEGLLWSFGPLSSASVSLSRGLGLIQGRFRADPCKNHIAVSIHWGSLVG